MRKFTPPIFIVLISILVISNISCEKNERTVGGDFIYQNHNLSDFTPKDIKVIDGHLKSVSKIGLNAIDSAERNIFSSLGSSWNLDAIETADYTFSNFTKLKGYLVRNIIDPNLTLLIYLNKGKYFKVFFKRERISFNIEKVTVTSPEGLEYMSYMLMDGTFLSHLKANKEFPFKIIMSNEEVKNVRTELTAPSLKRIMSDENINNDRTEVTAPPPPPLSGGCTDLSFSDCMQCAISECTSDWKCAIMCGLGAELCLGTWTVACTF